MRNTNIPFSVSVGLKTPIILSQSTYLTLDSVLAALIFAATGDLHAAHQDIPLQRTGQVWHGSAALIDSALHRTDLPAFKRGISPLEEMWAPAYQTGTGRNSATPVRKRVDTVREKYKTEMDQYSAIVASTLTWAGCGDVQTVRSVLAELRFVGKKSRQGWGQVDRIEIEEADEDLSLAYQGAGAALPLRPVPVDLWESLGHSIAGLLQIDAQVCPPYFDPASRCRCVVPASRTAPWATPFASALA